MNHNQNDGLLKMIRRTDPMIFFCVENLKTIEPMEVHRGSGTMCNTKTSKVISRTDPMIP